MAFNWTLKQLHCRLTGNNHLLSRKVLSTLSSYWNDYRNDQKPKYREEHFSFYRVPSTKTLKNRIPDRNREHKSHQKLAGTLSRQVLKVQCNLDFSNSQFLKEPKFGFPWIRFTVILAPIQWNPISRTSEGNENWFEKSGVRNIDYRDVWEIEASRNWDIPLVRN